MSKKEFNFCWLFFQIAVIPCYLMVKQIFNLMKHPRQINLTHNGMIIFKGKVKGWDWKKIERIEKTRLNRLRKQDWIDWENKIE